MDFSAKKRKIIHCFFTKMTTIIVNIKSHFLKSIKKKLYQK